MGSTSHGSTSHGSTSHGIYERHQALFYELLERLKVIEQHADTDPGALAIFLTDQLLPHVFGEEEYIYPRLQARGATTDTMSVDHEFIQTYVRRIEQSATAWRRAGADERPAVRQQILDLGRQLEAIIELHMAKENRIYLPLLEQQLALEEQRIMPGEAHERSLQPSMLEPARQREALQVKDMVDVRGLSPAARHARVFAAFGTLHPGEALILVSDRDPAPFHYQLTFEHQGSLSWEPLETGPDTWRIAIGKAV